MTSISSEERGLRRNRLGRNSSSIPDPRGVDPIEGPEEADASPESEPTLTVSTSPVSNAINECRRGK